MADLVEADLDGVVKDLVVADLDGVVRDLEEEVLEGAVKDLVEAVDKIMEGEKILGESIPRSARKMTVAS